MDKSTKLTSVEIVLKYKLLSDNATIPTRATQESAGLDLCSIHDVLIKAYSQATFCTGLCLMIPKKHYGRIAPRSGLAAKHGIHVLAGVLDSDYIGEVKVVLANLSDKDYNVTIGEKIEQLICEKICNPKLQEFIDCVVTERGVNGFGSSGIKYLVIFYILNK